MHMNKVIKKRTQPPIACSKFKVNNRNTRARYEICSKLTIVNFEHIAHLVSIINFENVNTGLGGGVVQNILWYFHFA